MIDVLAAMAGERTRPAGDAAGGRWVPPAVALAGPGVARYDDAPAWQGRAGCSGTFLPGARALADYVRRRWGTSYGGYSCRQNTAARDRTSVHGTGRAIDISIAPGQSALGDEIANTLGANAAALGVQLVIWRRTIVNYARPEGQRARAYTGPNPHTDHLHVELTVDGANRRAPWFVAGMPELTVPSTVPGMARAATGGGGSGSASGGYAGDERAMDDLSAAEGDDAPWWAFGAGLAAVVGVVVWRRRSRAPARTRR